jgi:hypothetical protein
MVAKYLMFMKSDLLYLTAVAVVFMKDLAAREVSIVFVWMV